MREVCEEIGAGWLSWLDDLVPDLVWLQLIVDRYGEGRCVALTSDLVTRLKGELGEDIPGLIALASEWEHIPHDAAGAAMRAMPERDQDDVVAALAPLVWYYPECPLAALVAQVNNKTRPKRPHAGLAPISTAVAQLTDRRDRPATFAQVLAVYMLGATGRMNIAGEVELPDLNCVSDYPDTDESMEMAAVVRALLGACLSGRDDGGQWGSYFWRRGYELSPCCSTPMLWREEDIEAAQLLAGAWGDVADQCAEAVAAAWHRSDVDLAAPRRSEVLGGLLSRQYALATRIAGTPWYWEADIGRIALRCMAEIHISLQWLASEGENDDYDRFVECGLGQDKLCARRMESSLGEDSAATAEAIGHRNAWIETQMYTYLVAVDVGSWSGKSIRDLAMEAGCKDIYDDYFTPHSREVHASWGAMARSDLSRCPNPLHRYHFIPTFAPRQMDISVPVAAVALLSGTYEEWARSANGDPKQLSPLATYLEIARDELSDEQLSYCRL